MQASQLSTYRPQIGWGIAVAVVALIVGLLMLSPVGQRFGIMGIEHILTGYDHLAFLVMLMIATRNFKELLWVISAFTVAHSITLSAATLGYVIAPAKWIEPLIVLTILYVAAENLFTGAPKARLLLTFGFGLIHGLGFAGALAEGPLPRAEELIALVSFNLGVEVGQVAFLAVFYPLWAKVRGRAIAPRVRQALALAVVGLSIYWLWERL